MRDILKRDNYRVGARFEEIAAGYLQEKGYVILKRNYRTSFGEIDMIARQEEVLVFLEIKFRSSRQYGSPSEAVDVRKRRRISKVALSFYSNHGYAQQLACRFDVIAIYGNGTIEHIENAFDYEE